VLVLRQSPIGVGLAYLYLCFVCGRAVFRRFFFFHGLGEECLISFADSLEADMGYGSFIVDVLAALAGKIYIALGERVVLAVGGLRFCRALWIFPAK